MILKQQSPLIVTGMHRSGTSMVASMLSRLGVQMGSDLVPPNATNPTGFFESLSFVEFHQNILEECTVADDGGHRDWGWTESNKLDADRFCEFETAGRELLETAQAGTGLWGWKDPRSTLFLDFWLALAPDAYFVLLYRFPWDVADSMQRLGADVFLANPEYAIKIWLFYNRHLLKFYEKHHKRCVLVGTDGLVGDVGKFVEVLKHKLSVKPENVCLDKLIDRTRFIGLAPDDPLIKLTYETSPECIELLKQLDESADLSSSALWNIPKPGKINLPSGKADISIIIPCFNHGQFIIEAIASVERSVSCSYELIIVNDGSTETRTLEVLKILRELGYIVLDQTNLRLSAARNRGIEEATGRYILPLDCDNRLRPGFVEDAISVLDNQEEIGVVYGDRCEFGMRTGPCDPPEFNLDLLLKGNYIDACAVFRKQVWTDVGGFDRSLFFWEDWEFWINAASHNWRFARLPQVTFDYRVRPNSLVADANVKELRERLVNHVIVKHWQLYERLFLENLGVGGPWIKEIHGQLMVLKESYCQPGEEFENNLTQIAKLRSEKVMLESKIEEMEEMIDGSIAWRLVMKIRHILGWMLPQKSRRRRWYDRVVSRFKST